MIKQLFSLLILLSMISFAQTEKLGKEITVQEKTKISAITSNPEEYLGKTVLVEGEVLEVCPAAGCWMELKSDDGKGKIKIKVRDGDIVFPMSAKGKKATVEGTVYKIELSKEEAIEYYKHLAEESGKDFDPSTVTGPVTIYQIKGLGAEIN